VIDSSDIDYLGAVLSGRLSVRYRPSWIPDTVYDFDNASALTMSDYDALIHDVLHTSWGDADLNGMFDSGDLVRVFSVGEYEDGIQGNSGWSDGDWNADGEFDSGDLVVAFQEGTYEEVPEAMARAVPEPSAFLNLSLALLIFGRFRRW
ncbi:MAG: hypothetical protein KDB23_26010, partial [Planctomycetales bacterium]|nr:hypothetical protein [Planctomycetales bacterium]